MQEVRGSIPGPTRPIFVRFYLFIYIFPYIVLYFISKYIILTVLKWYRFFR